MRNEKIKYLSCDCDGQPSDPIPAVTATPAADDTQKTAEMKDDSKEADNEDSLNLTIGEDDEKLLHDSNIEGDCKEGSNQKRFFVLPPVFILLLFLLPR